MLGKLLPRSHARHLPKAQCSSATVQEETHLFPAHYRKWSVHILASPEVDTTLITYHKGSRFARDALAKRMDQNWVHQAPGFCFGDISAFIWLGFFFWGGELFVLFCFPRDRVFL